MIYTVRFKKRVHSCFASFSSGDIILHYDLTMPFVPQRGIEFDVTTDLSIEITDQSEIVWRVDEGRFDVWVGANRELYEAALKSGRILSAENPKRLREIVQGYLEDGWLLTPEQREKFEALPQ